MDNKLTAKEQSKLQSNYLNFIDGIEKLSKKYGFAIQASGCFYWDVDGFQNIEYKRDLSSGDLDINILTFSDGSNLNDNY